MKKHAEEIMLPLTRQCYFASIAEQKLYFFQDGKLIKIWEISTSRNKPSCIENSLGTPLGFHAAADKIGNGEALGMVFKGRIPTGKRYWECDAEEQEKSLITTRIIRLRGLEAGKNQGKGCDTYDRYVYIHGTNHENLIGQPASCGCLHLRNLEIIEFFDRIEDDSIVYISEE